MTKREKERQEREMLKQMIKNHPKLKSFLEAATEESTENFVLKDFLTPVLQETFDKIRMDGIIIGWYAHASRCVAKIRNCKIISEAIEVMQEDMEIANKKFNLHEYEEDIEDDNESIKSN